MFTLKEDHLNRLCQLNYFSIPSDEMIFFGFRGCLPIQDDDHQIRSEHQVQLVETDYIHPRCTLGQWKANHGMVLFPGSTVPHKRYVEKSISKNGKGANQLMTGLFKDYRKGTHKPGKPTGHEAFRQVNKLPIRRTTDDLDYDEDDRVEFMNPFDNLHAAWCMGLDHDRYASAGCQVVVGYPKCAKRNNQPDTGPWKVFKENAYNISQNSFLYMLLSGRDAQKIAFNPTRKMAGRLRFGSKGDLAAELQTRLKAEGFYEGNIDGDFGSRTLFAVLEYQTVTFGPDSDDGIVGPITASALGMDWPDI